ISTASGHVRVLLLRQEGVVRRECRSSSFRVAMLAGLEPHGGRWDWGGSVAQRDLFDAKHTEGKLRIEIADYLGRLVAVVVIPPSDVDAEGEHRPTGAGDVGCGEDITLDATADDVLDQCRRVSAELEDVREVLLRNSVELVMDDLADHVKARVVHAERSYHPRQLIGRVRDVGSGAGESRDTAPVAGQADLEQQILLGAEVRVHRARAHADPGGDVPGL